MATDSPFTEHSMVISRVEIREGDEIVPPGALGTIVHVAKGGRGYTVEFTEPKHVVIVVTPDEIEAAQGMTSFDY